MDFMLLTGLLTTLMFQGGDTSFDDNCDEALGMQSMAIPESSISASSSYDPAAVGPSSARIRTEIAGGAWCPRHTISNNSYEYLQIDLQDLKVITHVETQGRFGNGMGQEYVTHYRLEFQREDAGRWFRFRNKHGLEVFQGNTNTYMSELRPVDPPIIADKIRFIPLNPLPVPKIVCMRVELYGCVYTDSCDGALGMQSMEIPDSAITASSSYDSAVGPSSARIRTELNGGAWCPRWRISQGSYEYLEVDLQTVKVITQVETQGRFGNGQGREWASHYRLEYQGENTGEWFRYQNIRGHEIIPGNVNTYMAQLQDIDPPIIARRIRFIPYSTEPVAVCMRVEIYGCDNI